jgi:hypothetical protein
MASDRYLSPLSAALLLVATLGCQARHEQPLVAQAQFGVYYGGQVQQRDEIPLVLDRARQTQGFHLEFREPLPRNAAIHWEYEAPGPARKRGGSARVTHVGDAVARQGRTSFDQPLEFRPGDAAGKWLVRVSVDGVNVISRSFEVYDPAARERAARTDAGGR